MGKHSAEHIPTRDLRRSYIRLREAYERLLRDHLELKNATHGLPAIASGGPSSYGTEVVLWKPASHLAMGREPLDVDAACELVRSSGLLTSPGLEA
ncbi:hypothetical protein [Streptomyces africanus]|uniref:hypothetical protein n=1 Tax=Streptomyces africanus TaxID=231024 RepID=UPI000A37B1F0|nr:hypothetical protein [Streptomyces africanus]